MSLFLCIKVKLQLIGVFFMFLAHARLLYTEVVEVAAVASDDWLCAVFSNLHVSLFVQALFNISYICVD